jgi:hypothetical protein
MSYNYGVSGSHFALKWQMSDDDLETRATEGRRQARLEGQSKLTELDRQRTEQRNLRHLLLQMELDAQFSELDSGVWDSSHKVEQAVIDNSSSIAGQTQSCYSSTLSQVIEEKENYPENIPMETVETEPSALFMSSFAWHPLETEPIEYTEAEDYSDLFLSIDPTLSPFEPEPEEKTPIASASPVVSDLFLPMIDPTPSSLEPVKPHLQVQLERAGINVPELLTMFCLDTIGDLAYLFQQLGLSPEQLLERVRVQLGHFEDPVEDPELLLPDSFTVPSFAEAPQPTPSVLPAPQVIPLIRSPSFPEAPQPVKPPESTPAVSHSSAPSAFLFKPLSANVYPKLPGLFPLN